ncbi:MAG: hypothetical protein Q8Q41_00735 [bacterium]|nr:hypothetical protein [bacterium]
MEPDSSGTILCESCSEGSCLAHCEICGSDKSVWDCDYAFPRSSARPPSSTPFEFRGLPEWRCNRPGNPQAVSSAIKFGLIVIGGIMLDFLTGGWLQSTLSAIWSLIFGGGQ